MSSGVREPVAVGLLYPADSQQLRSDIDAAINTAETEFTGPKLLVLPNTGLCAAPEVSGSAMLMLETERDHVDRVVLIADHELRPGERAFSGIAIPRSIAFRTPLGDLLVDRAEVDRLSHHGHVVLNDRPFERNESLEVHLPPVQRLLGTVKVVPMLIGEVPLAAAIDVIERVWGGRNTLIIASTDFARGDDRDAVAQDGESVRRHLRRGESQKVAEGSASSPITLAAVSSIIGRRSMGLNELDADTVEVDIGGGFADLASFGAWESVDLSLADHDAAHLRALALSAVHLTVLGGKVEGVQGGRIPPALAARRACVLTLRRNGQTRGSAGTIEADRSLAAAAVRNAAAACSDPRLPSIQPSELDEIDMSISIVSPIERIFPETWEEVGRSFAIGRHGVLVITSTGRAAQLPSMWTRLTTPEQFIGAVAAKANLDTSKRVGDAAWYRFEIINY